MRLNQTIFFQIIGKKSGHKKCQMRRHDRQIALMRIHRCRIDTELSEYPIGNGRPPAGKHYSNGKNGQPQLRALFEAGNQPKIDYCQHPGHHKRWLKNQTQNNHRRGTKTKYVPGGR